MKILKKRGVVEKRGGGGNEIHAPCACENNIKVLRNNRQNNEEGILASTRYFTITRQF